MVTEDPALGAEYVGFDLVATSSAATGEALPDR